MRKEFGGNTRGFSHFDPVLGRNIERIHAGGYCVMAGEGVISTLLGSCIAVCLRDGSGPVAAMNHFLLPYNEKRSAGERKERDCRFGVDAMDITLAVLERFRAKHDNLEAKVFGAADMIAEVRSVGEANIRFVEAVLADLRIPIRAWDVGGTRHRVIRFFVESGKVMVHRGDSRESLEHMSAGNEPSAGPSRLERRTL